jgi:dihydrolipoamide dehydrogenase
MHAFGVKVHLVEMMEHILPTEDNETVAVLARSFKKKKISVMTGTRALSLHKSAGKVQVDLQLPGGEKKQIDAEQVLCVFGRTPNTNDLGLEQIGLKPERGFIPVGDYGQTSVAGVFAIGDVVATPLLAHVASKEAENSVEYIAGHPVEARIDKNTVPSAIYCQPQIASFGLRETQAKERNILYDKVTFPYQAIGKAVATGKTEGLVKVLFDPDTEEILGGHIVGANATELIHLLLLAKINELIPEDIAKMIHAHPTLSEGIMEAMREVNGNAIHI